MICTHQQILLGRSKKNEMGGACAPYGIHEARIGVHGFDGDLREDRPPAISRRILEDNIKIYLQEVEWGSKDWNQLRQGKDR